MLVNSPLTVRLPRHHDRFCVSFGPLFCSLLFFLACLLLMLAIFLQSFFFSEADALILLFPASALHFAVCLKCIFSETF